MQKSTKIIAAKIAVGLGIIPVLVYAHASGPDPGYTGAPGDNGTCVSCHIGTSLNGGGGNVTMTSSTGTTYTPGQQQTFTITIADSKAKVYGFQITARVDSQSNPVIAQAGDFTAGTQQIVICADGSLKSSKTVCPSTFPDEYIEQSSPFHTNVINVTWTAPSTDVGTVTIYVAVNAANGNGNETGDHIYTTKLQLSPPASTSPAPTIDTNGAYSVSGFSATAGVSPGTWLEIHGANLAQPTYLWTGSDFNLTSQPNAPRTLQGVTVTIGGVNTFVEYVSPTQVNVQVPDGIPIGNAVPLVLTNAGGSTTPFALNTSTLAPALLAPPYDTRFLINGKQYVVAFANLTTLAGVPSSPAHVGDVLTIYGIGFGPVTPTTGAGDIAPPTSDLTNHVTFLFGQTQGNVKYQGLTPGTVGLYQFNVIVPPGVSGDVPLTVTQGSVTLNQSLFLNVAP